jgi:hypothetical protein
MHARSCGDEYEMRDAIHNVRQVSSLFQKNTNDVKDTRDELHAVIEAHNAVITRIRVYITRIHHERTGRRDGKVGAEESLDTQAAFGAILFATSTSLETSTIKVSLAALVPTHFVLEDSCAQGVLGAGQTPKRIAERACVLARSVHHSDLPRVAVGATRVTFDRLVIEAQQAADH